MNQPTYPIARFGGHSLSASARLGLLALTALGWFLPGVLMVVATMSPTGLSALPPVGGVLLILATLAVLGVILLVYAALLTNNPRISVRARLFWLGGFALAGPVAVPLYWFTHVRPGAVETA